MVFQKAVYHKRVLEPLLKCHNDDTRESHDQFTSLLNRGCTVKLFTEKTVRISGGGGSISKKKNGVGGVGGGDSQSAGFKYCCSPGGLPQKWTQRSLPVINS